MKLLGIDWGKSKVGLAFSGGSLAYPLKVIRYKTEEELINKLLITLEEENIEKIIIGISEGQSAASARKFSESLGKKTNLEIIFEDETLTTHDAHEFALEAGINRKKRKKMEDAFAATLILQNHLNNL